MNLGQSVYQIEQQLKQSKPGLGIDIDDTCAQTSKGFYDFLSHHYPPPEGTTLDEVRIHFALHGKTLYWSEHSQASIMSRTLVANANFHAELEPIKDAAESLQQLAGRGIVSCYITARLETMYDETKQWLKTHNFPEKPIIMKDKDIDFENNNTWKAAVMHYLHPKVTGLIDNDARIAKNLEQESYQGKVYLLGLTKEHYQPLNGTVIVAPTWKEIMEIALEYSKPTG